MRPSNGWSGICIVCLVCTLVGGCGGASSRLAAAVAGGMSAVGSSGTFGAPVVGCGGCCWFSSVMFVVGIFSVASKCSASTTWPRSSRVVVLCRMYIAGHRGGIFCPYINSIICLSGRWGWVVRSPRTIIGSLCIDARA